MKLRKSRSTLSLIPWSQTAWTKKHSITFILICNTDIFHVFCYLLKMVGRITGDIWSKKGNRIRDRFLIYCSSLRILLWSYDCTRGYDEGIVIGLKVTQYRHRDILGGNDQQIKKVMMEPFSPVFWRLWDWPSQYTSNREQCDFQHWNTSFLLFVQRCNIAAAVQLLFCLQIHILHWLHLNYWSTVQSFRAATDCEVWLVRWSVASQCINTTLRPKILIDVSLVFRLHHWILPFME